MSNYQRVSRLFSITWTFCGIVAQYAQCLGPKIKGDSRGYFDMRGMGKTFLMNGWWPKIEPYMIVYVIFGHKIV